MRRVSWAEESSYAEIADDVPGIADIRRRSRVGHVPVAVLAKKGADALSAALGGAEFSRGRVLDPVAIAEQQRPGDLAEHASVVAGGEPQLGLMQLSAPSQ